MGPQNGGLQNGGLQDGGLLDGKVAVAAPRRSPGRRWVMRVSAVGEIALQRTPYFAMASAVERVRPTMPSLAAE